MSDGFVSGFDVRGVLPRTFLIERRHFRTFSCVRFAFARCLLSVERYHKNSLKEAHTMDTKGSQVGFNRDRAKGMLWGASEDHARGERPDARLGAVYGQIAGAYYGFGAIPERWVTAIKDFKRDGERPFAGRDAAYPAQPDRHRPVVYPAVPVPFPRKDPLGAARSPSLAALFLL